MAVKVIGQFSYEEGILCGPRDYMEAHGRVLLDRILAGENAIFNLKFGYTRDNADGIHYSNEGYRTSVNLIYPLWDALRLQLGGDIYFQDYKNENTTFNTVRKDRNYTGTVGLTWSVFKHVDLIAQYMYTRVNSNIYAYDYKRDIYSLGMELKF